MVKIVAVKVTAVPHKGPAWGLEMQPQQVAKNKAWRPAAWMTAQSTQREGPLGFCAPGAAGEPSLLQGSTAQTKHCRLDAVSRREGRECSGHHVICGTAGKAGVVWPRVDGFGVALFTHPSPTFIEHTTLWPWGRAAGLASSLPSENSPADKGREAGRADFHSK